ncbi:MAG: hypothetical protein FJX77_18145, partial [Armatimonadetes bacterium]|nr:hypothetical protein [Armatimonadota bacterium]
MRFTPNPALRDQKLTLAFSAPPPPAAARRALAALLQAEWIRTTADGEHLRLTRKKEVLEELARRRDSRGRLEEMARQEQAALMASQFELACRSAKEPAREGPEGGFGKPGVVPDTEPILELLETFPAAWRQRLFRAAQFPRRPSPGLHLAPQPEPALAFPFSRLNPRQQNLIREYLRLRFEGKKDGTDYSRLSVSFANDGGRRIVMGFHCGYHGEALVLIARRGTAERNLAQEAQEPLFSPSGPTFSPAAPRELGALLQRRFRVDWSALDYGEAVQGLSASLGLPVFADYYSLRERVSARAVSLTGAELLKLLHLRFRCWFAWTDGILLVRRPDWPDLDQREIPAEWEARWRSRRLDTTRRAPGQADLPLAAEIAGRLRDPQLECLMAGKEPAKEAGLLNAE